MTARARLALAIALFTVVPSCGFGESIDERSCPPGGTKLTYENFGREFFDGHCTECHGAANGYSSRSFQTVESIREQKARIYVNAAASNTTMPPGPDDPPRAEREKLAEWLACGAP
jgi:hypothetical protein